MNNDWWKGYVVGMVVANAIWLVGHNFPWEAIQ